MKRREFLGASVVGSLAIPAGRGRSAGPAAIDLPADHLEAVQRRKRRIVIQHDVYHVMRNFAKMHADGRAPFAPFEQAVFSYVDEPDSQIDAIWWDIGGNTVGPVYPSEVLAPVEHPQLQAWLEDGIDWVEELVNATRQRKLEVFWNHRISEVDGLPEGGHEKEKMHPLKAAHPDWVVPCSFWWQGMWNLASAGLREHKIAELRELASRYDLDGIQIDFSRHMPILPVGRQWEMREHVTEFMRGVRLMLLEVASQRGQPFLLAAKVPRNLAGCRVDGLDVGAWAEQRLVDVLTLGSRAMDVDVEGFREVVGEAIQLQPCFDDHHTTDGYRYGPIEYLRGVFANHWQRGANSVVAFNWPIAVPEVAETVGGEIGSLTQQLAFREIGDPQTLAEKDKIFAVERRGGYPWSDGFINRNDDAPLPVTLPADGTAIDVSLSVSDAPNAGNSALMLRCVLYGAGEDDTFEVRMNGARLDLAVRDPRWKDAQIFSPKPQPTSGGKGRYKVNPQQQLLRLDWQVPSEVWKQGASQVAIRVLPRAPSDTGQTVQVEKVEGHLNYD